MIGLTLLFGCIVYWITGAVSPIFSALFTFSLIAITLPISAYNLSQSKKRLKYEGEWNLEYFNSSITYYIKYIIRCRIVTYISISLVIWYLFRGINGHLIDLLGIVWILMVILSLSAISNAKKAIDNYERLIILHHEIQGHKHLAHEEYMGFLDPDLNK